MKKMLAFALIIAFVSLVFAPLPAFAGGGRNHYGHGGNHGGYRGHSGISTGAAVGIGLALVLGVLVGRSQQATVVYGPQYPQPPVVVYPGYPQPAPVVVVPEGTNCRPSYDNIYDDPFNPGLARMVANPYRLICSNGQVVVIPR
ncbi:MAG: hypothetical protein Q7R91_01730 [bacterium]|nr:hypothetical protein [bacterium]